MGSLSKRKASALLERARVELDLTYDDLAVKFGAMGIGLSRAALFAICAGTWPHKLTRRSARKIERFLKWADGEIAKRAAAVRS